MNDKSITRNAEYPNDTNAPLNLAFGAALVAELDAVGFHAGPGRSAALAKILGLSSTQARRVLKGIGSPSINSLWPLRSLGVSLDRIVDKTNGTKPITQIVYLNGEPVPAVVQMGVSGESCGAALIPRGTRYEVIALRNGTTLPENAIPIRALGFEIHPTIAIVEDDITLLAVLDMQLSDTFHTAPFCLATNLLEKLTGNDTFQAILMDWRLPDMDGEELVKRIREKSRAPIFVLTGDLLAEEVIARAMDHDDVFHALKPAQMTILIKRISKEIARASSTR